MIKEIQLDQQSERVFINVKNVGLLGLLIAFAPNSSTIYFLKPGKRHTVNVEYLPLDFKYSPNVKNYMVFLHAFRSCDSTSAFFRQGRLKFVKTLENYSH